MQNYLIESYAPRGEDRPMLLGSARARIAAGTADVRVLWAIFAPDDELCLWVLSAPSRPVLEQELARAGIEGRIQDAVALA